MKKLDSVKENVSFRRAYHKGKSYACPIMSVYWRKNGLSKVRLGITVSKKLGSSPCRNRVRRIIRAAVWQNADLLPQGCDVIIVARSAIKNCKSTDVEAALRRRFGEGR